VFTGGIGENDIALREEVMRGLEPLGIEVDPVKNVNVGCLKASRGVGEISWNGSRCKVLVVKTNEEVSIATQAGDVIDGN
jgi:acetate kinase